MSSSAYSRAILEKRNRSSGQPLSERPGEEAHKAAGPAGLAHDRRAA
jgi:hypothetical protein